MNKLNKKLIVIAVVILCSIAFLIGLNAIIKYVKVKNAKIEVTLVDYLVVEFNDTKKVSDFITSINGTIIDDYTIDTSTLGKKEISFAFINNDGIKVNYTYEINVVDTVAPVIWLSNSYSIAKGSEDTLTDNILCGDNYDSNPICEIIGEYDLDTIGSYPLTFKATDVSGNVETKEFTLQVYEPKENNPNNNPEKTYTNFNDIIHDYKTENTKIGIDVSGWQGNIDFEAIKNAGVEFIIIKVGGTKGTKGDYYVDSKFLQNIKGANEVGLEVGIYFFSYAESKEDAIKDAKWLIEQIKEYKVTLPIAYDWENWSDFNSYHLSFYELTSMAESFLKTVEDAGYKGMLYSSKSYLEKIWLPTEYETWLAHYTNQTNYKGEYKFWQICDNGVIDGIDGVVDIDILFE